MPDFWENQDNARKTHARIKEIQDKLEPLAALMQERAFGAEPVTVPAGRSAAPTPRARRSC